jgi:hypothetical protein
MNFLRRKSYGTAGKTKEKWRNFLSSSATAATEKDFDVLQCHVSQGCEFPNSDLLCRLGKGSTDGTHF